LPGTPTVSGYEIHMGISTGPALATPALTFVDGRPDGAISDDGQVLGSYVHGLFDSPDALMALLRWAGAEGEMSRVDLAARREADLDRLADAVEAAIDVDALLLAATR
ncbi:MAG: cobyric acid synthase CobQ, partial [Betaproteobacteria bacterium HGW-Betaproteobacteria-21]